MIKHILVPTDGSALSSKAIREAIALAQQLQARITVLHVVPSYHPTFDEGFVIPELPELRKRVEEVQHQRGQQIVDAAQETVSDGGIECDTVVAASDTPYEMIISQAVTAKCDLIVMASHGYRGVQGLLIGSETLRVLTHSTIPVLVCR
jgi:nucleotide-binding universal stress UspA family protein